MNKTYFYRISKNIFGLISDYLDLSTLLELDWNLIESNGIHHGRKDWNQIVESIPIIKRYNIYRSSCSNWEIYRAAEFGSKRLVKYVINNGLTHRKELWDWGMRGAAHGGHRELVDYFISLGAKNWKGGIYYAALGGHKDLVKFFKAKLNLSLLN